MDGSPKKLRVLIAPLDWGLGHATRCMRVADFLLENKWEVAWAHCGRSGELLRKHYPDLDHFKLEGAQINYPANSSVLASIIRQGPGFLRSVGKENKKLEELCKAEHFDLIISDNRYGLHHDHVPSVMISHQLNIQLPGLMGNIATSWATRKVIERALDPFEEIWVPDSHVYRFSGSLSENDKLNSKTQLVGLLSRFQSRVEWDESCELLWDYLKDLELPNIFLISGPQPAATAFAENLKNEALHLELPGLMAQGKPEDVDQIENVQDLILASHLPDAVFDRLIQRAEIIICRSGYSTLMDISVYGKKALLIPTPGQTEQEYLADLFTQRKWSHSVPEKELDLARDISLAREMAGIPKVDSGDLLLKCISRWKDRLT
jgi:hypothetical protein